ncbi:MAG: hypothetical protein WAX48_08850 [Desulfosalsimonadaceae bacterium]
MLRWGLLHIPGAPVSIRSNSFPVFSTETKGKGPHRNGLPSAEVICSSGKKRSQKSSPVVGAGHARDCGKVAGVAHSYGGNDTDQSPGMETRPTKKSFKIK